jgi:sulfate transport system ATP-binding protein/putative spermidine/putrescine transport system ATP-binding protein
MLLLDEPFSALDEALKIEARNILKAILEETRTPALLITHDSRDLDILANKVTRLERGQIISS